MRLTALGLDRYAIFSDTSIPLYPGLTVVAGPNESGKSTALTALADLLWGMPQRHPLADIVPRAQLRLTADVVYDTDVVYDADTVYDAGIEAPPPGRRLLRTGRGLLDADGIHPAPHPWGTDGDDHRAEWLCCFGLSHQMLREGGQQICAGAGDLAELVFTARRGSGAQQLLKDIDQRADFLFKSHRGNKSVQTRAAMEEYRRRRTVLQQSIIRSSDVVAAENRLHRLTAERDEAAEREAEAGRRLSALLERRRCWEHVHRLRAVRQALTVVRSQGVAFDQESLHIYDQAVTAIETSHQRQSQLREQIEVLTRECDALTVDEALLADASLIDGLHAQAEARVNDAHRAHVLVEEVNDKLREAEGELVTLTGHIDCHEVGPLLDELSVPADLAAQLDNSAEQHTVLVAACQTATARVDDEQGVLEGLQTVPDLPQRKDLTSLLDVVGLVEGDDSPLARVRTAQQAAIDHRCHRRQALLDAGCLTPEGICPTPPFPEHLQREIGILDAARTAATLAAEWLKHAKQALTEATNNLAEVTDHSDIVDPQQLRTARADRDMLWRNIRRVWLHDNQVQMGSPSHMDSPHELAVLFERTIQDTDRLADRLAEQADLTAQISTLRSELAAAETEAAAKHLQHSQAQAEYEQAQRNWNIWWTDLGVSAPSTIRAEAVRQSLLAATNAHLQSLEAEETTTITVPELVAVAQRIRDLLTGLNRSQPEVSYRQDNTPTAAEAIADVELLLAAAHGLIEDVDNARETRQQRQSAERALTKAQNKARKADQALAKWTNTWHELVVTSGMPGVLDPAGWHARRQHLVAAETAYADAQRQRTEADGLLAAWTSFSEQVTALGQRHKIGGESADIIQTLWHKLTESRSNQRAYQDRHRAIATAVEESTDLTQTIEEAKTHLAGLHHRYGVKDETDLFDAVARGRDILGLHAEEAEHLGHLNAALEPGHNPDDMLAALADTDTADLDVQCALATTDLDQARQQRERLVHELGAADHQRHQLMKDGDAATLHALAQEQLAEVADLTEQYAVLHLQRMILREQLEIHARRHTSPLLHDAGRILQQLTAGRWVALHANDDGARRRFLEIVRGDGEPFAAGTLSEGTADQVFLAMRLASIVQRQTERHRRGQICMPVVFDDVLMTFDNHRATCALHAMADAATQSPVAMQIIVFTHHTHIADLAAELARPDITVTRLKPPPSLPGLLDPEEVRTATARPHPPAHHVSGSSALSNLARMNTTISDRDIDPSEVRAWAKAQGITVAGRGRVSADLIDQYRKATGQC